MTGHNKHTICVFCGKPIPAKRLLARRNKYCSIRCNQRAWYVKHLKLGNSSILLPETKEKWEETETGKGYLWEALIAKKIGVEHLNSNYFGKGADLKWGGLLIDVKTSELYKRVARKKKLVVNRFKQPGWWGFNRGKFKPEIDFFLCVGLINGKPYKVYLIPSKDFPMVGACISPRKSKYNKYLINIDI